MFEAAKCGDIDTGTGNGAIDLDPSEVEEPLAAIGLDANTITQVPFDDRFEGAPNQCHENVARIVESTSEFEGCFGYSLAPTIGPIGVLTVSMFEHSILRKSDGSFVDPTPTYRKDRCLFLPDPDISFETRQKLVQTSSMIKTLYKGAPIDDLMDRGMIESTAIIPFGRHAIESIGIGIGGPLQFGALQFWMEPTAVGVNRKDAMNFANLLSLQGRLQGLCGECDTPQTICCKVCNARIFCSKACAKKKAKIHKKDCAAHVNAEDKLIESLGSY